MFARADGKPRPGLLGQVDADSPQPRIALEEVLRKHTAECLRLANGVACGQGIDGVLHRIGRQDFPVVAVGVRLVVFTLEPDRDGEIFEVVAIAVARHLDEPDARFSVGSLSEHVSRFLATDHTDHTNHITTDHPITRPNRREHQCLRRRDTDISGRRS